jgi:hypothetical protein
MIVNESSKATIFVCGFAFLFKKISLLLMRNFISVSLDCHNLSLVEGFLAYDLVSILYKTTSKFNEITQGC